MEASSFSVHCTSVWHHLWGGNARREASALTLHLRNTNLVQMSWACCTCSRSGDCFHYSHTLAHSHNAISIIAWFFLDKPWGCLLEGQVLAEAADSSVFTGQEEQCQSRSALPGTFARHSREAGSTWTYSLWFSSALIWPPRWKSRTRWHLLCQCTTAACVSVCMQASKCVLQCLLWAPTGGLRQNRIKPDFFFQGSTPVISLFFRCSWIRDW